MIDEEDKIQTEKDINNIDIVRLVTARIETMSDNMRLMTGSYNLNKADMIKEVENKTETGKLIVYAHMNYLRSLKDLFYFEIYH